MAMRTVRRRPTELSGCGGAGTAATTTPPLLPPLLLPLLLPLVLPLLVLLHALPMPTSDAAIPSRKLGGVSLECGGVFLTVSSLWRTPTHSRALKDTELELNWELACDASSPWAVPDWVGLFTSDPTIGFDNTPVVRVAVQDFPDGFYRTNVSLGKPPFPGGWTKDPAPDPLPNDDYESPETPPVVIPGPQCLPFWIASFNNNTLVKVNCLKIQPTWMYDNRLQLGWTPVSSLLVPGTHNSGCYHKGNTLTRRDLFQRWVLTQDRDIWMQLVHGIRYLDFRVGYYGGIIQATSNRTEASLNSSYKFWINHDLIRVTPLLPLLRDIRRFMELAKGELIFLDFHRFPVGFQSRPQRHQRLIAMLEKELGHLILPATEFATGSAPTLDDIWAKERRLIISYGDDATVKDHDWLWGSLHQFWGNEQTAAGLDTYLDGVMKNPAHKERNPMWAAMAQLTPTTLDVMFKPHSSLRHMADEVNRNLTTWLRTKWWQMANVVATDFFLGNNVIDVAINSNIYRSKADE